MKKNRRLHLWIGLISSVFILVESITGLLLSEPWLLGGGQQRPEMRISAQAGYEAGNPNPTAPQENLSVEGTQTQGTSTTRQVEGRSDFTKGDLKTLPVESSGNISRFIRGLHEGRIGTMNAKWLVDATAIALIILTSTGIILSVQTLRAQSKRRKKRAQEAATEDSLTN